MIFFYNNASRRLVATSTCSIGKPGRGHCGSYANLTICLMLIDRHFVYISLQNNTILSQPAGSIQEDKMSGLEAHFEYMDACRLENKTASGGPPAVLRGPSEGSHHGLRLVVGRLCYALMYTDVYCCCFYSSALFFPKTEGGIGFIYTWYQVQQ